jgi:hypothetical protein
VRAEECYLQRVCRARDRGGVVTRAHVRVVRDAQTTLVHEMIFYQAVLQDRGAPCATAVTNGIQISLQP